MKFVELVDNEGKVHYVNPDQICSIQPIFSVSGPKDRGPEGSRVRINGYTRALLFDEVPIDVIDTIHVQAISGGVAKFHAQEPGVRRGPEPSPYVAGPASMSREDIDRYMNSTEPFSSSRRAR